MVIVAGLPRSGTSAVASVVAGLGVDLGPPWKEYRNWYPRGSFVSRELHDLFLTFRANGCADASPIEKAFAARKEPWGFKAHSFLPIAAVLANFLPKNVNVIRCDRPIKQCRASLHALGRKATVWWILEEWGIGVDFLASTYPTLTVNFSELIDPTAVGKKISSFIGRDYQPTCVSNVDFSLSQFKNLR